jgi:hypothetical protein
VRRAPAVLDQMVDAMILRARLRDLAVLGRSQAFGSHSVAAESPSASPRCEFIDTPGIDELTPPHPKTPSSRPGADDLMASTI